MAFPLDLDKQSEVALLSYVTRLLLSELDRELMAARAVENLADLAHTDSLGLFSLDQSGEKAICLASFRSLSLEKPRLTLPANRGPAAMVAKTKEPALFGLSFEQGVPWPVEKGGLPGRYCACAPLVAGDNQVTGLVTFPAEATQQGEPLVSMPLLVCLTVTAMGLETARLFEMAVVDGLTGLFVRRYFDYHLAEEEGRLNRYGGRMALLIMDLDHFKLVNDTHGHLAGDAVLRGFADLLKRHLRAKVDIPCRYGGEEFAVIMPHTTGDGAALVAERIRKACQDHGFNGSCGDLGVTVSLGLACMDDAGLVPAGELLRRADQALLAAKAKGRNRVEIWRDGEEKHGN